MMYNWNPTQTEREDTDQSCNKKRWYDIYIKASFFVFDCGFFFWLICLLNAFEFCEKGSTNKMYYNN